MQPSGICYQWLACALYAASSAFLPVSLAAVTRLPPAGKRVSFAKHGGDWVQGTCASRKKQSPIDLNELFKPPGGTFMYKYDEVREGEVAVSNDGRFISASLSNGSLAQIGGLSLDLRGTPTWFNLTSIDVKAESEHTLRGKHFPLEIQLVHKPAHFYANSEGPQAVTVSIFVDCPNPPQAPPTWPGLLQKKHSPPRKPRRAKSRLRGDAAVALTQQNPEEESTELLLPPGGTQESNEDDDPMNQRMNSEINFVHTLVEGEDALGASPAAAPAAAPAGAPASTYAVPRSDEAHFSPLLQFLVAQDPPDLDTTVNTAIGHDVPFNLNPLLAGGTYFYYWGSDTLPPCAEQNMWLIRREPLMASRSQVQALYDTVHLMTDGAGNFRTGMPLNHRAVEVLSAKEGIPREVSPPSDAVNDNLPGTEQRWIQKAQDAITISKAANDYAKDLDWRLQSAATAHLRAMEVPEMTTAEPTTSAYIPKPPEDQVWATNIMTKVVKNAIHKAVQENIKEMVPATVSLAGSYLRQRVLKKAGYGPPPVGATVVAPTPIPGVPTFFPSVLMKVPSEANMSAFREVLIANNCTHANATGCQSISNITGYPMLSPTIAAEAAARFAANGVPGFGQSDDVATVDDEEDSDTPVMTPEQVAQSLPAGVAPVPKDWPDEDAWPQGLPPSNCPAPGAGCDPDVWPNPDGAKPTSWSDYQWRRYRYNWNTYRTSYQPYRSSYSGYSINRRRRQFSSTGSSWSSSSRRYRSSYGSSSRRRSYSSSYSSSGRRRSYTSSRSSYSSGRRRSYS